MILPLKKDFIKMDDILKKIDPYDIYRYYYGDFTINTPCRSPFHQDRNPSFCIYAKEGSIRYIDYSDLRYQGNCFDFVRQLFTLSLPEATEKIAKDFGIIDNGQGNIGEYERITSSYEKPYIDGKRYTFIQIRKRKFEEGDIEYWGSYGLTVEDLVKNKIHAVQEVFVNRRRCNFRTPEELVYAYEFDEGLKIYFPQREKGSKWKSNITTKVVEGDIEALKQDDVKKVLITKARKDRILIGKYANCIVLNTQNETQSCFTEEFRELLKDKEVFINFDNDTAGVKNCIDITTNYRYNYINVPKQYLPAKDFTDLYKLYGEDVVIKCLKDKNLAK